MVDAASCTACRQAVPRDRSGELQHAVKREERFWQSWSSYAPAPAREERAREVHALKRRWKPTLMRFLCVNKSALASPVPVLVGLAPTSCVLWRRRRAAPALALTLALSLPALYQARVDTPVMQHYDELDLASPFVLAHTRSRGGRQRQGSKGAARVVAAPKQRRIFLPRALLHCFAVQ